MKKSFLFAQPLLWALVLMGAGTAQAADPAEFEKSMDTYLQQDKNVEKIGDALQRFFQKKQMEAQQAQMKAEEEEVEDQFKNPVKVDLGDAPVRGPANAKVTIVAFSDFECPFCSKGATVMDEVMRAYPNDVKLAFKNLPLPFHSNARPAAKAALAAKEQGKFWEMHDLLFRSQEQLGEFAKTNFEGPAKTLGLNVEKFKSDYNNPNLDKKIDADAEQGSKLGVRGTPGFFVNGVQVKGARPFPYFKTIIDRWLQK